MSFGIGLFEERWGARRMRVRRWLVTGQEQLDPGAPICKVEVDGQSVVVPTRSDGWIGQKFVNDGEPVPLDGSLALGSSHAPGVRWPDNVPRSPLSTSFSAADLGREQRLPNFRVFVSYRRGDAEIAASLLAERIDAVRGANTAFLAPRNITLGVDFYECIHDALHRAAVCLVILGPGWLNAVDERGHRRLDTWPDVVQIDVQTAINRGIPVIPVLVEGAALPRVAELPQSLRTLPNHQGVFVRTDALADDVNRALVMLGRWL